MSLDRDAIILTPHRSRSHLSDLLQVGVAHGFDGIYGQAVSASLWRFDREVDRDSGIHLTGESLVRPRLDLPLGITSVTACCRSAGFLSAESCYPPLAGKPDTFFRHRFMSMWLTADGALLRLSLKPHYLPESIIYLPTATDGDPATSPLAQRLTLLPEEWVTFVLHRFDQTVVSFEVGGRAYDVDEAGFRPAIVPNRFARVRRGVV